MIAQGPRSKYSTRVCICVCGKAKKVYMVSLATTHLPADTTTPVIAMFRSSSASNAEHGFPVMSQHGAPARSIHRPLFAVDARPTYIFQYLTSTSVKICSIDVPRRGLDTPVPPHVTLSAGIPRLRFGLWTVICVR